VRHRLCTLALLAAASAGGCSNAPGDAALQTDEVEVDVADRAVVDVPELSALTLRERGGKIELVALGDRAPEIAVGELASDLDDIAFRKTNVRAALEAAGVAQAADVQWEAVASDASGRIFVLEENPGKVIVFSPDLSRVDKILDVEVSTRHGASESLAKDWAASANSRGEGLALLAGGHVLLLKEKQPRRFVELGPEGDPSLGIRPIGRRGTFALPSATRSVLVPLREWKLDADADRAFLDLSDLAVDDDGAMFVLSDEGRAIGLLGSPQGDTVGVDRKWSVSSIDKPEGLAIFDGRAIVASDRHGSGHNLFRTKRLR
jgi:hypothetical protein